ncbi:guided entry of tail-anchored proteins factor 1-like [Vespa mandarinia]|uniref:guided entry of tail-anchored proteins factor 1-like n=1 Tax=Vespa mandarinia TaxID=7446 RepID=UPI00161A8B45|nr:guided entry of tail-anchored proteins factor 1-like [Vespa mandarinia]XP_046814328.1 guided entry of tail-anchored proteins factor 1-like [Vespa crabro]XP_047343741.1 guided entry of tail-anchored proteins factor 1-like [Vespa velutina]
MNLLLISTLICILEYIVPIVITYFTAHLYVGKKEEAELRKNLATLRQEMASISMVDEFSKYAKLQRKYNKLENTLKDIEKGRLSSRKKARLLTTYGFRIINGILIVILLYIYNNEPIIKLPKDTLWPINYLLRWPTNYEDSISLIMWFVIAKIAISKCTQIHIINNH